MNKQEKSGLVKGLLVGYVLAEIMPEKWNPINMVKDMFNKQKAA